MKKEIFIRADGSELIGLGHLTRCYALAKMIEKESNITFFSREISENFRNKLISEGYKSQSINNEEEFYAVCNSNTTVIVDSYEYTNENFRLIAQTGAVIALINDIPNKYKYLDLIINPIPNIKSGEFQTSLYTQLALGIKYVLLRPAFLESKKNKRNLKNHTTLFLSFGGADPNNYTRSILEILVEQNVFNEINVVLGSAYIQYEELEKDFKHKSGINLLHDLSENEMLHLMQISDIAIVPSSGILLEALASGCRIISGMTADNQAYLYNNYRSENLFFDAGNFTKEEVLKALSNINKTEEIQQKTIDFNSGSRNEKLFNDLEKLKKLSCSLADESHLDLTYKWASDKAIRKYAFSNSTISYSDHEEWFKKKLTDTNCLYIMIFDSLKPIGSVRFDRDKESLIISYLIDSELHGKGYGKIVLHCALKYLEKMEYSRLRTIEKIVGYVKYENKPSIAIFRSFNFKEIEMNDRIKFEMKVA